MLCSSSPCWLCCTSHSSQKEGLIHRATKESKSFPVFIELWLHLCPCCLSICTALYFPHFHFPVSLSFPYLYLEFSHISDYIWQFFDSLTVPIDWLSQSATQQFNKYVYLSPICQGCVSWLTRQILCSYPNVSWRRLKVNTHIHTLEKIREL